MRTRRALAGLTRRLARRDGSAAIEFGILAPILGLVFAGVIDLGGVVLVKFRLDNAVSAGANYAIVNADSVTSSNGATLASTIATIITNGGSNDAISGTIMVNGGPTAVISYGSIQNSGAPSNANNCYCPSFASTVLTWGDAISCGSNCDGGGRAGKFVEIATSRSYTPLFSNYGIVGDGAINARAVVQTE